MASPRVAAVLGALLILACSSTPPAAPVLVANGPPQAAQAKPAEAQKPAKPAEAPKQPKPPSAKMAEPWPDAATLAKRRIEAEKLPLFQQAEPLTFTLAADFRAVNRDRDPDSTKTYPAVLTVPGERGGAAPAKLEVTLRTRGILRLNARTCAFVPLRIDFPKKAGKGTVFEGQEALKVVTHCENDDNYEQYVLLEYLAYRLYNLVTPHSYRVRLGRATYVDSGSGKTLATRSAFFIEDEGDMARRMDGRSLELPRTLFSAYNLEAVTLAALFQFMIGNTDYSYYSLHNAQQVQTQEKLFYPVIWDFDVSGLVSPVYGAANPELGITSLRQRLYRGPCRTMEQYEPSLAVFRAKQAEMLALVDAVPGLTQNKRRDAARYLGEFFSLLGRPDQLKKELIDKCRKQATM